MKFAFEVPDGATSTAMLIDGSDVTTWDVVGHPMIVRESSDTRELRSSLGFDFVHGGYLRQLVDDSPFGVLRSTAPVPVERAEAAQLSCAESGPGPSMTYVLSAVAENDPVVRTLQISYPLSHADQCDDLALRCIRSARFEDA